MCCDAGHSGSSSPAASRLSDGGASSVLVVRRLSVKELQRTIGLLVVCFEVVLLQHMSLSICPVYFIFICLPVIFFNRFKYTYKFIVKIRLYS